MTEENGGATDRVLPEAWDEEGINENLCGVGLDLIYYKDFENGVQHYVLLFQNEKIQERTFFIRDQPAGRLVLDGAKEQFEWAKDAAENSDLVAAFAFTWRALRLIFPDLPEEPIAR